jgi:phosphohistidine phosphatase
MPRLLLLRHAKSSWDDASRADHERPLAPRGRRATGVMAAHLRDRGLTPELVLCSSAVRTRETLAGIGDALGDEVTVEIEDGIYGASETELLDRVRRIDDAFGSAMVIGHNPGIGRLALHLVGSGEEIDRMRAKFPTAALAVLDWDGAWQELAPRRGRLVDFVTPKGLGAR